MSAAAAAAAQVAGALSALFRSDALDTAESAGKAARGFVLDTLAAQAPRGADAQREALASIVDACVGEQVAQTVAAAVLGALASLMGADVPEASSGVRQATLRHLLEKTQERSSAFESVAIDARRALANILVAEEKWEEAAVLLQGIRFEQSQRTYTAQEMFGVHVSAMELFLAAGLPEQAAQLQSRAAALFGQVADAGEVSRYRFVQARINDLSLRYIEAAAIYHTVAQSCLKDETRQKEMLERAIRCAVLASAGPQKMRVMSGLHHEKLAAALPCYGLLENMVLKRLVKPAELQQFSEQLESHQRSLRADGKTTLLDHAVREHNVFVLSSLYTNIRFGNLGRMLGVDADAAELLCARMIEEGRMKGRIDQVDGLITFEGAHEVKEVSAAIFLKSQAAAQPPPMHFREVVAARWDGRIVDLCTAVEDAVDLLIERHPTYCVLQKSLH